VLQSAIFLADETSQRVKAEGRKRVITVTDIKMRYDEGCNKREKHTQFLHYFRFTFYYFRNFLQATFVTVHEAAWFVVTYFGNMTLRHLIVDNFLPQYDLKIKIVTLRMN
jgi:hypothetical protein